MKIIETKVYKFEELSEAAQETAIDNFRDINTDYDWWESVYWDAENIGLKLTGFDLDRHYCKGDFILDACEVSANIFRDHGENTETYKTAKSFIEEWQPIFNDYMNEDSEGYESADNEDKLLNLEEDFLNSLLEDYRIILQKEYEYQTSEEAVKETLIANEYDFTEDGDLF